MQWDAQKYNETHDFISKYGENLLNLFSQEAQTVLDVGCGTGELTNKIAQKGYLVTGIDVSDTMLQKAQESYPELVFYKEDILCPSEKLNSYDVVFSNAVFHWIKDQATLIHNIYQLLNQNGQLVCEFGAVGNVGKIRTAFHQELQAIGFSLNEPFCFTSAQDYRKLLEKNHLEPLEIIEYERPTILKNGKAGLREWMCQFYPSELKLLTTSQKETVLANLEKSLFNELWKTDHWEADYRRLKIQAVKS